MSEPYFNSEALQDLLDATSRRAVQKQEEGVLAREINAQRKAVDAIQQKINGLKVDLLDAQRSLSDSVTRMNALQQLIRSDTERQSEAIEYLTKPYPEEEGDPYDW